MDHGGSKNWPQPIADEAVMVVQEQQLLRRQYAELELLYRAAPVGLCLLDRNLRFVRINDLLAEINGISAEHHIGKNLREITPDLADQIEPVYWRVIETGEPELNFEIERKDIDDPFKLRNYLVSYFPLADEDDQIIGVSTVVQDITDRKQNALALRLRDQAFASCSFGITIADATQKDTPVIYCNPSFEKLTGYKQKEVVGRNCRFLQGDDRDQPGRRILSAAIKNGRDVTTILRNYRKDGSQFWSEVRISCVRDESGCLTHFIGFQNDVTDRVQAETALRENEERYRQVFNQQFQFMAILSPQGRVLEVNDLFLQGLRTSRSEFVDQYFWLTPAWKNWPEWQETIRAHVQAAVTSKGTLLKEEQFRLPDGSIIFADSAYTAIHDVEGGTRFIVFQATEITERRQIEANLRESKEKYRSLVKNAPVCIHEVDSHGNLMSINDVGLRMLGLRDESEVIGLPYLSAVAEHDRDRIGKLLDRAIESHSSHFHFETPDGKLFDSCFVPLADENMQISRIMGITQDITERVKEEQQFRFTQFSVDSCSTQIFWIRRDASFFFVNHSAAHHFGYTSDELLTMTVHDIDPNYPAEVWPQFWESIQKEKALTFESTIRHKDGHLIPVEISTNLLVFEDREFVFAFVNDISRRQQAEEKIRASEARFRALVENSYDVINMFAATGELIYTSPSVKRVLGYEPEEMIQMNPLDLIHPDDVVEAETAFAEAAMNPGSVGHFIHRLRHKDGNYRTVEITGANLLDLPGINAMVSNFRDITERSLANEALQASEMRYRAIVEDQTDLIVRWNPNGVRTFVNDAYCRCFGKPRDELLGTSFFPMICEDDFAGVLSRLHELTPQNPVNSDVHRVKLPDGSIGWQQWTDRALFDDQQQLVGYQSVGRDMTSQKNAELRLKEKESELAHVSRLSTMGEMVAGIAHEVKQPLHAVANFATAASVLIDKKTRSQQENGEWLRELQECNLGVRSASNRANEIIQRLQEFSKKGKQRRLPIDLQQVLIDSLELVAFEARNCGAAIETEFADELPSVRVDQIQIEQVFVNLFSNAFESLAKANEPRRVRVQTVLVNRFIEVRIEDNGPGLNEELSGKLFEAFYTTKTDGLGMGLAISRTIVEDHGGRLWADNHPAGGAVFFVSVPIFEQDR